DMEQARCLRSRLPMVGLARLTAPGKTAEHEHALAVKLAVLLRLEVILRPDTSEPAPALCHAGESGPAARRSPVGHRPLDRGMGPDSRAEVAAFPVGEDRAHEVHVLGHRLYPFGGKVFGGSTGLVDVRPNDHALDHPLSPGDRVA